MDRNAGSKPQNQRRMGPAPFASFEDLSDEMESPSDEKDPTSSIIRLPGILEQDSNVASPVDPKNKCQSMGISLVGAAASRNAYSSTQNPVTHSPLLNRVKPSITPRIDISRASSSSHQDSRDSTPEREICDSTEENNVKLGLGFKEDGALELRLSTEELDFQENAEGKKQKTGNQTPSPEPDESYGNNRKDSQCSDVILLSISGRTSRLSSIGSQGSAKSRFSNASHFSVTSGHSAYSQCSSPHKTILETSFCGHRLSDSQTTSDQDEIKGDSEEFEKLLLSRKSNPTEVALIEGLKNTMSSDKPSSQASSQQSQAVNNNDIQENNNEKSYEKCPLPKKIISKSGVEYIYIPLKGPLPTDDSEEKNIQKSSKNKFSENVKKSNGNVSQNFNKKPLPKKDPRYKSSPINLTESSSEQPKYIRIKLKPDHCYDDKESNESTHNISKPMCLNLSLTCGNASSSKLQFERQTIEQKQTRSLTNTPSVSPKSIRKNSKGGSTPSPSVPRRNSLASMFRTGPESPGSLKRKRKNTLSNIIKNTNTCTKGRSKSVDKNKSFIFPATSSTESVDSKGKANSILSIFKTSTKEKCKSKDNGVSQDPITKSKLNKKTVERKQESPLNSQSIRIPLHSPTYYTNRTVFQELSQDPQVTVIEGSTQGLLNMPVLSEPLELSKSLNEKIDDKAVNKPHDANQSCSINVKDINLENNYTFGNETNSSFSDLKEEDFFVDKKKAKKTLDTTNNNSFTKFQDILSKHTNKEAIKITASADSSQHSLKDINECGKQNNGIDDDHNSSESERDLEIDYQKSNKQADLKLNIDSLEIERKAIVFQQDSFEDELPYIPTTLPLERSAAIPILPIKQRCVLEVKTCPIERPRSTTPIHSSGLENYIDGFMGKSEAKENNLTKMPEKLKISLPRTESANKSKTQLVTTTSSAADHTNVKEETPPPLPPKGIQKTWINFEEVPERRKPPKRIQTIPSRGHIDISGLLLKDHVVYTYVNPEECKCECHEHKEQENDTKNKSTQEEEMPLLDLENQGSNSNR